MNTKKVIEELIDVNNPPDPWGGIEDEPESAEPVLRFVGGGSGNRIGVITSVADSIAQMKGSKSASQEDDITQRKRLISDQNGPTIDV